MSGGRSLMWFFLVLLVAAIALFHFWLAPQLRGPARVGMLLPSVQEAVLDSQWGAFRVSRAKVLAETDQSLSVRYDYTDKPPQLGLMACGDIRENTMTGPWGCQPRRLVPNSGSVVVNYVLANATRPHECSDQVTVTVYADDGNVRYRHAFSLKKVWHREPGMAAWYHFKHQGCPLRTGG